MRAPFNRAFAPERSRRSPKVRVRFDYNPFPQTIALHQAGACFRERVAVTGARGGKTTAGVADVRHHALDQPGHDLEDVDRGEPYSIFIGAPDYPTVKRVILPAFLRAIPQAIIAKPYHHTDHLVKIHGRRGITDVYFLTSKFPDTWQGVKANFVWLDEFARLKEQMYDEARTRLMDRRGDLLLTSTPHGQNWVYDRIYKPWKDDQERIKRGEEPKRKDLYFTTWRTIDNARLTEGASEEIERHRQTMPAKYFKRTYEASWDAFEGQVYEEWSEQVHVAAAADYMFIISNRNVGKGKKVVRLARTIAGVDWGSTKDHKGVILVLGKSVQGIWYVLEESVAPIPGEEESILIRGRTMLEDSWTRRALELRAKWRIDTFYCDPAAPANLRMLREANLQVEAALNAHAPGLQCVARFLHVDDDALAHGDSSTRLQVLDTCETTIEEIRNYHWKDGSRKEEPEKVMDDTMDALRYALYTSEERGVTGRKANFDFA